MCSALATLCCCWVGNGCISNPPKCLRWLSSHPRPPPPSMIIFTLKAARYYIVSNFTYFCPKGCQLLCIMLSGAMERCYIANKSDCLLGILSEILFCFLLIAAMTESLAVLNCHWEERELHPSLRVAPTVACSSCWSRRVYLCGYLGNALHGAHALSKKTLK